MSQVFQGSSIVVGAVAADDAPLPAIFCVAIWLILSAALWGGALWGAMAIRSAIA